MGGDHNCVILWTNKARCVVNKEIFDLLNEESISGARIAGIRWYEEAATCSIYSLP